MDLGTSFRQEFGLVVVGAIVFIASLMWKDFLVDIEDRYFPKDHNMTARFVYTLVITIVVVFIAVYFKNKLGIMPHGRPAVEFDDTPIDDDDRSNGVSIDGDDYLDVGPENFY